MRELVIFGVIVISFVEFVWLLISVKLIIVYPWKKKKKKVDLEIKGTLEGVNMGNSSDISNHHLAGSR